MKKSAVIIGFIILFISNAFAEELTLEKSIEQGLKNNDQIIVAQEKVNAAKAKVTQALSYFFPSISLSSNYTRNYTSPIISTFTVGGKPTSMSFGIDEASDIKGWEADLRQNIFTFGKLENGILIALDNLELAKQSLRKAKQDLIFNIASTFINVVKAKELYKLAQDSLEMAQAHVEQVSAMFDQGILTKADVLRSEVQKISANQNKIKAGHGIEIAESVFNSIIGNKIDASVSLNTSDIKNFDEDIYPSYEELLKNAFENRPDLKEINTAKSISDKNLGIAKAGIFPSIQAQASYGSRNTNYPVSGTNYDTTNWSITGAASWNLFDGFNIQAKINEAHAQLREAFANKKALEKAVELDVKQSYLKFIEAKEMVKSSKKEVESAKENYDLAVTRFKNGLNTNVDVLDARTALTQAKTNLLSSQFDVALSLAQIEKSIGLSDIKKAGFMKQNTVYVDGVLKYIELEGGFLGFIDNSENKYDLYGEKSKEILKIISNDLREYKARIWGRFKKDIVTIHMWGRVFEVEGYEWK